MEENKSGLLEMTLDHQGGVTLQDTARWSKFVAIVGIAGLVIFIFALVLASAVIAPVIQQFYGLGSIGEAGLAVLFALIVLVVLLTLVITLYLFAVHTRRGIETQDQDTFNRGLNSLRIYFLISGILAIISLAGTVYSTIIAL